VESTFSAVKMLRLPLLSTRIICLTFS
jgi:hypothetical protein